MAYLVGGFFGSIGKFFKKAARVVGKVAGTALGVASALVPGPAGRIVAGVSGKLAGVKSAYRRVQTVQKAYSRSRGVFGSGRPPGFLGKVSPIMPGGSIATHGSGIPPILRGTGKRRKRKASRKRTSTRRRTGRKLKFGSPAWRKKYMRKGRR